MEDGSGSLSCFQERSINMQTYKYVIGIDVSKKSLSVCIKDAHGKSVQKTFPQNKQGFLSLLNLLLKTVDAHSSIIGIESTSIYHIPVLNFLNNHGFKSVVINPCLVEKFSKLNLRPSKTDKKDASTIADFLSYSQPLPNTEEKAIFEFKIIAREREKLSKRIAHLKDEIQRTLSALFPELTRCQIFTLSMLKFLRIFPSANAVKRADKDILYHTFNRIFENKRGKPSRMTLETLSKMAEDSIGIYSPALESILKAKINDLINTAQEIILLNMKLVRYARMVFPEEMKIITSIPGVGKTLAAYFLAEVQDIKRFGNAKKLIAFVGLDPVIKQSGKRSSRWGISKRGNKHLRRVVYIIALNLVRNCDRFRRHYERLKERGKKPKVALIAVANKFLRCAYAMLTHRTPYSQIYS
jgi:transposase